MSSIMLLQSAASSPTTGCPVITSHGATSPPSAIGGNKRMLKSATLQPHSLEHAGRLCSNHGKRDAVDADLATEIGEGLMGEIRKLHSLLQQTQDTVNSLKLERAEHQQQIAGLDKQLKQRSEKEEQLNEEIWNLELAKQDLAQQLQDTSHELSRMIAEQRRLEQNEVALLHELDRLRTAEHTLAESGEKTRQEYEHDMIALRKVIAKLKRENQKLSHEKASTERNCEQSLPAPAPQPEIQPQHEYEQSLKLEIDTLQKSLSHAHTAIGELEDRLEQERMERANTERLLQEAQECAAPQAFWRQPASLGDELLQASTVPTTVPPNPHKESLDPEACMVLEQQDLVADQEPPQHQTDDGAEARADAWQVLVLEPVFNDPNELVSMTDAAVDTQADSEDRQERQSETEAPLPKNENYGSLLVNPKSYIYSASRPAAEQALISPARATAFDFDPDFAIKHDDSDDNAMDPAGNNLAINTNLVPAVTRTMIGDWMTKYMRKRVGTGMSENQHRRFFWVHPYTRTLYWGPRKPGTNADNAKSATIVSFRVVPDGVEPPCIVVETRTRDIKIRCLSILAHRAWIKALHYLVVEEIPADLQKNLSQSFLQNLAADKRPIGNASIPFCESALDRS